MGPIVSTLIGAYVAAMAVHGLAQALRYREFQAYVAAAMVIAFIAGVGAMMIVLMLSSAAASGGVEAAIEVRAIAARLPDWMFAPSGPFFAGAIGFAILAGPFVFTCPRD